ncbi:hypothetical protein [Georgenia sp. SUBG003]|uniref:hypothetical protein n=1 Tax=Georgenia sp. SUBG003 TaxID=1497974 RepID=UPI003AB18C9C
MSWRDDHGRHREHAGSYRKAVKEFKDHCDDHRGHRYDRDHHDRYDHDKKYDRDHDRQTHD